jgi:phytoene synthase
MIDLTVPPDLRPAYETCRALTRRHGTTYYVATRLLPRARRPHVYALYGFCRYADDIVDEMDGRPPAERAMALAALGSRLRAALAGGTIDATTDPVVAAVARTAAIYGIESESFERFLRAMTMDLSVRTYTTWGDLCDYMDGSAAVIGEMMLPILGGPRRAAPAASDLGLAFQLTNFLRDVGEDLDRGRVYLPVADLERFGAHPRQRQVTPEWRALMQFEIDRARRLYASADVGIAQLPRASAGAIATARHLYAAILDAIEANAYDVFSQRARVTTARKLVVAIHRAFAP